MASNKLEITTTAPPAEVWDAVADIGALHTRLVPGFVVRTEVEARARVVTFGNGMTIREPIVSLDPVERRLVWTAEGAGADHYNGALQVVDAGEGSRIIWIADFLPDDVEGQIKAMMQEGMAVMKRTLDSIPALKPPAESPADSVPAWSA